jgi:hypothetical protein
MVAIHEPTTAKTNENSDPHTAGPPPMKTGSMGQREWYAKHLIPYTDNRDNCHR